MLDSVDLMFIAAVVGLQMMFPYSSIGRTSVSYSIGTVCSSKLKVTLIFSSDMLKKNCICKSDIGTIKKTKQLLVNERLEI